MSFKTGLGGSKNIKIVKFHEKDKKDLTNVILHVILHEINIEKTSLFGGSNLICIIY